MAIKTDTKLVPRALLPAIQRLFELSRAKILSIEKTWKPKEGTPVFTVRGHYAARGWTEWTQGFQYGSPSFSTCHRRAVTRDRPARNHRADGVARLAHWRA
jgi:hypothetical protein